PAVPVAVRLRSAIILNDLLLVKRILRNHPEYLQNPNFDDNGNTSLHLAAIMGHLDIIKFLVERGHDSKECQETREKKAEGGSRNSVVLVPEISTNGNLSTPLHLAATHSHASCVEYLCDVFPQTIDRQNDEGATPLMLATRAANCRTYVPHSTTLLPPQQRPTPRYVPGHTPTNGISAVAAAATAAAAAASAAAENTLTVSILLRLGADVNMVDYEGNSALHYASAWGNIKTFRLLLGAGAYHGIRNKHGFAALDYAVSMNTYKYCRSLVSTFEGQQRGQQHPSDPQSPPSSTLGQPTPAPPPALLQHKPSFPKRQRSAPKLRLHTLTTDFTRIGGSSSNWNAPFTSATRSPMSALRPSPRGPMSASSAKVVSPADSSPGSGITDPYSALI
ncbi:hypothetical protein KEM55_005217, partial [Ascosphaera atra]